MKESSYPLERSLGMQFYASETPGIGGRLRTSAEDFVVEEIPCAHGTEGPFLICRLTKKDWDQQRAVKEVARQLGISYKRIGFSGTKDKHAVTSQLISIRDATPEKIGQVSGKDLELEVVGRSHSPIALGSHQANRFTITIREADPAGLADIVEQVSRVCREAIPNYFGLQRFGVIRPLTHTVGALVLKGDYEGAVLCYVGAAFPEEPEEVRRARMLYLEDRDALAAIRTFPLPLSYERTMLHHLAANPEDFRGALLLLPPKLLSMLVSAYQSFLFNSVLSRRFAQGGDLVDPLPGDRLLFSSGKEDRVTVQNRGSARVQVNRRRCRIAIRMPGCREESPGFSDVAMMASLLERDGIAREDFCRASDLLRTRFDGASRPVSLSTDVDAAVEGQVVRLSFELGPGQYATTVCREYMKGDPRSMI
jgi:tRNA pseudouridine13 synthase